MKRVFSTLIAAVLLFGLGALVYLALPNTAQQAVAPNPIAMAAPLAVSAAAPDAPSANAWNAVALPLDDTTDIPDAEALSQSIAGTQEVLRWNVTNQIFDSWIPDAVFPFPGGFGTNFPLEVGGSYFVLLDGSASTVFTVVGDVPAQTGDPGAVQFAMVGNSSSCLWNSITLPLDHSAIADAEALSVSIGTGTVQEVLQWNASTQIFDSWIPDAIFPFPGGFGTNFATKIGYPYFVCLTSDVTWP